MLKVSLINVSKCEYTAAAPTLKEELGSAHFGPLFLLASVEVDVETVKSGLEIIKS